MLVGINKLFTVAQIRELEQHAIAEEIAGDELMQRAGKAAFDYMAEKWIEANSVIVFCGGGNNGGDGYVLAQHAFTRGLDVSVRYVGDITKLKNEAFHAMQSCKKAGISILPFAAQEIITADIFVDALLGIGVSGAVHGSTLAAIEYINHHAKKVLALDVPSGINADTGSVLGAAVKADCTMTFIGAKQGLFTGEALDYCGAVICDDLNLPSAWLKQVNCQTSIIELPKYLSYLKPRPKSVHKGMFGHVLIIGGGEGMSGAPRMAALGAARVGAGLVTVATLPEYASLVNILQPELMAYGIKDSNDLLPLLERATVVAIGPGLGHSEWARELLATAIAAGLPLIVDADGLNLLADEPTKNSNWILTPHPGEAARLLHMTAKQIQQDRFAALKLLQQQYGGIAVLKGAGTLVIDEQGHMHICCAGNAGMASGGMGDILTGVIAGLVAQGMILSQAAILGVCLHAQAGDSAALNGGRGMLATDLLPYIREFINEK